MTISIFRGSAVVMLTVCALALTACHWGAQQGSIWKPPPAVMFENCKKGFEDEGRSGADAKLSIDGCTWLIDSGKFKGLTLIKLYATRARSYLALDSYHKAIEDSDRALRIEPGLTAPPFVFSSTYFTRATAYLGLKKYRLAIRDFDESLRIMPGALGSHINRGNAYFLLGEFRLALKDHNEAVRIDPKHYLAYISRGNDYKRLGDLERAVADWERAIQVGGAWEVKWWQEYLKAKGHFDVIDGHYKYGPDLRQGLEACAADPDCEAG